MRTLRPQALTAEAFAPYGQIVQAPAGASGRAINAGTTERLDLVDDLQLHAAGGRATLALFRAQARQFPLPLREMERHALGSQSFLPLGSKRFVLVVAPAGNLPEAEDLAAFLSDGLQGVVLAPGTWHHALLAVEAGDFVVIERAGATVDCDLHALAEPALLELSPPRALA